MDLSPEVWDYLQQLGDTMTDPFLNAIVRIFAAIIINIFFYNLIYLLQKHTLNPIIVSLSAWHFGLLNIYIFSSWNGVFLVTALSLFYVACFEIVLMIWDPRDRNAGSILIQHYAMKCCCILSALFGLKLYNNENMEEFIIVLVVIASKMMSLTEDLLQREHNEDDDPTDESLEFKTFFDIMGYIALPAWISFKDFKKLAEKQPTNNFPWIMKMCFGVVTATFLYMISYYYFDKNRLGEIKGRPAVLFLIHAFQQRCKFYYRVQVAELEALSLGVKTGGWMQHYFLDFMGAEAATIMVDLLIAFTIPISAVSMIAPSDQYTVEIFIIFALIPVVIKTLENASMVVYWTVFCMTVLTHVGPFVYLMSCLITVWRLLHFVAPIFYPTYGVPPVYMGQSLGLFLILCSLPRLVVMFNLKMSLLRTSLFFTILGLALDISVLSGSVDLSTQPRRPRASRNS